MCGRFSQRTPAKQIAEKFGVEEVPPLQERYNVAPTQAVLGVRAGDGVREAAFFKWGLVPRWAKDPTIGHKLINARSETVTEKPSFREAFTRRRILVPTEGFYEWQRQGAQRKQPFYFHLGDGAPFAIAGLWERWEGGDEPLETCTLLTTAANSLLASYHVRMPVIIKPEDYELWLDADVRRADLLMPLLCPYPHEEMIGYPVSSSVNSPRNQGAELVERATVNS
jgi:putative SOS response-associated peptidase YedK